LEFLAKIDMKKSKDTTFEDMHREQLKRNEVLEKADIVVSPLQVLLTSGSGKNPLDKYFANGSLREYSNFDTVIVDDANLI
jgi:hypothetical protein